MNIILNINLGCFRLFIFFNAITTHSHKNKYIFLLSSSSIVDLGEELEEKWCPQTSWFALDLWKPQSLFASDRPCVEVIVCLLDFICVFLDLQEFERDREDDDQARHQGAYAPAIKAIKASPLAPPLIT